MPTEAVPSMTVEEGQSVLVSSDEPVESRQFFSKFISKAPVDIRAIDHSQLLQSVQDNLKKPDLSKTIVASDMLLDYLKQNNISVPLRLRQEKTGEQAKYTNTLADSSVQKIIDHHWINRQPASEQNNIAKITPETLAAMRQTAQTLQKQIADQYRIEVLCDVRDNSAQHLMGLRFAADAMDKLQKTFNIPEQVMGFGGLLKVHITAKTPVTKALDGQHWGALPGQPGMNNVLFAGTSFVHEWAHALDRYLLGLSRVSNQLAKSIPGVMDTQDIYKVAIAHTVRKHPTSFMKKAAGFLSDQDILWSESLRSPVVSAWSKLLQQLNEIYQNNDPSFIQSIYGKQPPLVNLSAQDFVEYFKSPPEVLARAMAYATGIQQPSSQDPINYQPIQNSIKGLMSALQPIFLKNGAAVLAKELASPQAQTINEINIEELQKMPWLQNTTITKNVDGSATAIMDNGSSFTIKAVADESPDMKRIELELGKPIAGAYEKSMQTIYLKKGASDMWTLGHEYYHVLEEMGILSQSDIDTLNQHLNINNQDTVQTKEARANFVEQSLQDRDFDRQSLVGRILQKISDWVDSFVNFVSMSKFREAQRLIRDIERGELNKVVPMNAVADTFVDILGKKIDDYIKDPDTPKEVKEILESDFFVDKRTFFERMKEVWHNFRENGISWFLDDLAAIMKLGPEAKSAYQLGRMSRRAPDLIADTLRYGGLEWTKNKRGEIDAPTLTGKMVTKDGKELPGFLDWVKQWPDATKGMLYVVANRMLEERSAIVVREVKKAHQAAIEKERAKEKENEKINKYIAAHHKITVEEAIKSGLASPYVEPAWMKYTPGMEEYDKIADAYMDDAIAKAVEATWGDDKIKTILKWTGNKAANGKLWEQFNNELQTYNDMFLNFGYEAGLYSKEFMEKLKKHYYVPFWRHLQSQGGGVYKGYEIPDVELSIGKLNPNINNLIHEFKGSDKQMNDPFQNLIKNWMTIPREAMRNASIQQTYQVAEKLGLVIIRPATVLDFKRSGAHKPILSYYVDGKKEHLYVKNLDLFLALGNFNPTVLNNAVMKAFNWTKHVLTRGVVFGPAFKIANALKDSMTATFIERSFIPIWDTMKGALQVIAKDPNYIKTLGGTGIWSDSPLASMDHQKAADWIMKRIDPKERGLVLNTAEKIGQFWNYIGHISEASTRVGLYDRLIKQGVSHADAIIRVRNLTDFTNSGRLGAIRALTTITPFLGARMQGVYSLAKGASQDKVNFITKGLLLSLASLALWAYNKDDERYRRSESWEKNTYEHFWVGDNHFRIPKPFEVGTLFSTLTVAAADVTTGREPTKRLWDALAMFAQDLTSIGLPQLFAPLVEIWANKSFFTGRPIVPEHLKAAAPEIQRGPNTSTIAIIAGKLGIPPLKVDHFLKGYFSSMADFVLGGTDLLFRKMLDIPTKPAMTIGQTPALGRFWRDVHTDDMKNTKYTTWYYEMMSNLDKLMGAAKFYQKTGQPDELLKTVQSNKELYALSTPLHSLQKKMFDINRAILINQESRTLTPAAKRAAISQLEEMRNNVLANVYKSFQQNNLLDKVSN